MASNLPAESENSSVEDIRKDIDLINSFSADFFSKNNAIIDKMNNVMNKLNQIIATEKQNETYLNNLKNKVSDSELNNIMKTLLTYRNNIDSKSVEYTTLIEQNKKVIQEISMSIRNNDTLIKTVSDLVNNLDDTTTKIENKIKN